MYLSAGTGGKMTQKFAKFYENMLNLAHLSIDAFLAHHNRYFGHPHL